MDVVGFDPWDSDTRSMHPFFKKVLTQDNGVLTPTPSEPASVSDPSGSEEQSPSGIYIQNTTPISDIHFGGDGASDDIDIDPNEDRRKRRKTSPSGALKEEYVGQDPLETTAETGVSTCIEQSEEAAKGTLHNAESDGVNDNLIQESQYPPSTGSTPMNLAIRKSPQKTPRKPLLIADGTPTSSDSTSRPATRSNSKDVQSPPSSTIPKKKVIKLNRNGKLLSSPQSQSPASKLKGSAAGGLKKKDQTPTRPSHKLTIRYRTGQDPESSIGHQIDKILSKPRPEIRVNSPRKQLPVKSTHPFFLGKAAAKPIPENPAGSTDGSTKGQESDGEVVLVTKPPDWKDLGFKSNRSTTSTKTIDTFPSIWPPKDMQHIGCLPRSSDFESFADGQFFLGNGKPTSKRGFCFLSETENVLHAFSETMAPDQADIRQTSVPERVLMSGRDMLAIIESPSQLTQDALTTQTLPGSAAIGHIQNRLIFDMTAFDLGIPSTGQSWLSKYAPKQAADVLQWDCGTLREWLASHTVQNTKISLQMAQKPWGARGSGGKKRRKKKLEDLDDFIVDSDEEEERVSKIRKNAILITGPGGCGKTASIFAVAKELDFEVFEIHPGMRRSAKDIFDKVGDMTQNHLVQKAAQLDSDRASSVESTVIDQPVTQPSNGDRNAMRSFLGSKKKPSNKSAKATHDKTPVEKLTKVQNRKQSLILFEEVEILFEEDKAFWTGVMTLIEQSKRPVILTCNDPSSVPLNDLPLQATLTYVAPPEHVVVDYILTMAATEGHWLKRDAVCSLYRVKGRDLRATIAELDFWCQMAVGSKKAGLDWMLDRRLLGGDVKEKGGKLRVFSKNTYFEGLGLVPQSLVCYQIGMESALLQFAQDELQIPVQYWHEILEYTETMPAATQQDIIPPRLFALQEAERLAEASSVLDLMDETDHAELSAAITNALAPDRPPIDRVQLCSAYLKVKDPSRSLTYGDFLQAFDPLQIEKSTFPPSTGRLAPSLDTSSTTVVTDIAPYVRSIVAFDRRLEQQRDALSEGYLSTKTRKTRASRAALEGGDKASIRSESWFPRGVDFDQVLRTGGNWPVWHAEVLRPRSAGGESTTDGEESREESTASTPAPDVHIE